ncbi:MAG: tRNA (adenosine(37)-N6)-threonylcarbamoyltransferase complex transferase subunit TsaD [Nitrospiraceae bacterium]
MPSRSASPIILGVETSCDETAAAVIGRDGRILSSVLSSQHEVHARYGGVVPELAARRHLETMEAVAAEAMKQGKMEWPDLDGVAVTCGPGLAGALLVGVSFGKAVAYARSIPLIAVNHLEGHMASAWLETPDFPTPCVILIVSGGHTHLYLVEEPGCYHLIGRTLDDAAGEAFDKAAKMLQLGFPGGPAIDRAASTGRVDAVRFPRPYSKNGTLDFSFSGLKTALLYHLKNLERGGQPRRVDDLAASFQEAIVDVLVEKAFEAVRRYRVSAVAVVGGVSANSRLRTLLAMRAEASAVRLAIPCSGYCTDNAAMIASAGRQAYLRGRFASWNLEADPSLAVPTESGLSNDTNPEMPRRSSQRTKEGRRSRPSAETPTA